MEGDVVYLWLGFEALPLLLCVSWLIQNARRSAVAPWTYSECKVLHLLCGERHGCQE